MHQMPLNWWAPEGRQSINRAELAACVIAIGTFQNISLVCDSAFALGVLNKLLDGVPAHKWVNLPNYDLVLLLAEAIQHGPQPRTIITKKIKSHCAFDPLLSDNELLDFFGNQQADVAAGAALGRDVDWVQRQRDVAHARIHAVRDRFLRILPGIGALHATKRMTHHLSLRKSLPFLCASVRLLITSRLTSLRCRVGNLLVSEGGFLLSGDIGLAPNTSMAACAAA